MQERMQFDSRYVRGPRQLRRFIDEDVVNRFAAGTPRDRKRAHPIWSVHEMD